MNFKNDKISKNIHVKVILTVWSNFGSNLAIRSSYNRWKHFIVIGSSQDWFSTIGSQIWSLNAFTNTWVKSGPLDQISKVSKNELKKSSIYRNFDWWYIVDFFKKSVIFRQFFEILFRLLRASFHSRFYHWFIELKLIYRRYCNDFPEIVSGPSDIRYIGKISPIKTDFSIHV